MSGEMMNTLFTERFPKWFPRGQRATGRGVSECLKVVSPQPLPYIQHQDIRGILETV